MYSDSDSADVIHDNFFTAYTHCLGRDISTLHNINDDKLAISYSPQKILGELLVLNKFHTISAPLSRHFWKIVSGSGKTKQHYLENPSKCIIIDSEEGMYKQAVDRRNGICCTPEQLQ